MGFSGGSQVLDGMDPLELAVIVAVIVVVVYWVVVRPARERKKRERERLSRTGPGRP